MDKTIQSRTIIILIIISITLIPIENQEVSANFFPEWPPHAIYIGSTGNISPETDLIVRNGNTYTLTGNINKPIVIGKENSILDGNGYSLLGNGSYAGVEMSYAVNVTIKNLTITSCKDGIYSYNSNDNLIINNTIKDNSRYGIKLVGARRCNITDNIIESNEDGIVVSGTQIHVDLCYISGNTVRYNTGNGIDILSDNILDITLENNIVVDNGANYNIVGIEPTSTPSPTPTVMPTSTPTPTIEPTSTPTSSPESSDAEFPVFVVASIIIIVLGSIGILTYIVKIKRRS